MTADSIAAEATTVELDWSRYVDAMSALQGLDLEKSQYDSIAEELRRIHAIAQIFLDFPLTIDVEPAPIFVA